MKPIDLMYSTMYAELAQRIFDDNFASEFSTKGRFVKVTVKGRAYWYFDMPGENGRQKRKYVGPDTDKDILCRVERFSEIKAHARNCRALIRSLKSQARLPGPEQFTGDVVEALATAGFFRLRGVLIGTVAYQCYPAYLGVQLPLSSMKTGDVDFAQFHSISTEVDDIMDSIGDALKALDPSFQEVLDQTDGRTYSQYANYKGYKVEFLTPNRGSDVYLGEPAKMPALGTKSAQPISVHEFLISNPVRAVLLHGSGVPIFIPAPERYAVHKLIVASRRKQDLNGVAEREEDVAQALTLMEALVTSRHGDDLAEAFDEAWNRGEVWREGITRGLHLIHDRERLASVIRDLNKSLKRLGAAPVIVDDLDI